MQKNADRRFTVFGRRYSGMRQRLFHEHLHLLPPGVGYRLPGEVGGKPDGELSPDGLLDDLGREEREAYAPRHKPHVLADELGDAAVPADLPLVDEPLPAASPCEGQQERVPLSLCLGLRLPPTCG